MKKVFTKRKLRHGGVALMLSVLIIACAIVLNVIAAMLCMRYDWMYVEIRRPLVFDVSEECYEYIEEYVIPEVDRANKDKTEKEKIKVILCDSEKNIRSEQLYGYILDSIEEISARFEGYFEIEYLNIWEHPTRASSLGVTSTEDVVCVFGDKHQTVNLKEMFLLESSDGYEATPTAYNGEKMLSSCFMSVTQKESPVCYLTVNHGEIFEDYEFVRMIAEAGYTIGFLDLFEDEIPEDCDMLVTFDPKKDMAVNDDTSDVSEIARLEEYMSQGGKYMVFLSADTFASGAFVNFEGFLASMGVKYMHQTQKDGVEGCYLIRDTANSLSVDGYTVLAQKATEGKGAEVLGDISTPQAFGKTTAISYADGFTPDGKGNAVSKDGKTVVSPLLVSHSSAIAWANGRAVARAVEEPFMLMTMSERIGESGERGYLLACASVSFASEGAMRSSVLGNSRTLTQIVRYMGKDNAPVTLVFKPFGETNIQSITTREANITTAVMTALPIVVCASIGAIVLVRRRQR